jgi:alkyl hydroperoxide reductase subunit AhpF
MALLSDQDRQLVQGHLAGLQHQVTLLFFTQTIGGPETALIAKQILTEVAGLSEKITLEEVNFILDRDRAATYAVDKIPAIVVLRNGEDTRIRFFGAPAGYEFMSLVEAIILAGDDDSGLSAESKKRIASVHDPIDLQVFVTPT